MIPKQLQKPEFRFCLIRKQSKAPYEKEWQKKGYKFDDPKLQKHLKEGGNYGVIGGYGNLRILDIDKEEFVDFFDVALDTFSVTTGSGGRHFYFISDYNTNHVLANEIGELRANNYQVVCVGSVHPNGKIYKIIKDVPIKKISERIIKRLMIPHIREELLTTPKTNKKDTSGSGLEYRRVLAMIRERKTRNVIYKEMMNYRKWASSRDDYKNTTYNKAMDFFIKEQGKEKPKEIIKKEVDFETIKKNLREIYKIIINLLKKYLDLREDYYPLITIWIIGTHFHKEFETYPYLFFNAMRGSGKTRMLKLISKLIPNGDLLNDISESVLFRTAAESSFCIDEFEMSSKEKNTLKLLLNSAYKKGAKVKRIKKTEKGNFETEEFDVYAPICLANIWGIQNVLEDRCISLILEKSNDKKRTKLIEDFSQNSLILKCNSLVSMKLPSFIDGLGSLGSYTPISEIQRNWNVYVLNSPNSLNSSNSSNSSNSLNSLYNKINDIDLSGRDLELFFPLYIVADLCNVLDDILRISHKITRERKESDIYESKDVQLYDFVSQYENTSYVPISDLTKEFREFLELEEKQETWVNSRWMGKNLKKLVLVREKKKIGSIRVILDIEKAKQKIRMFKEPEEKQKEIEVQKI